MKKLLNTILGVLLLTTAYTTLHAAAGAGVVGVRDYRRDQEDLADAIRKDDPDLVERILDRRPLSTCAGIRIEMTVSAHAPRREQPTWKYALDCNAVSALRKIADMGAINREIIAAFNTRDIADAIDKMSKKSHQLFLELEGILNQRDTPIDSDNASDHFDSLSKLLRSYATLNLRRQQAEECKDILEHLLKTIKYWPPHVRHLIHTRALVLGERAERAEPADTTTDTSAPEHTPAKEIFNILCSAAPLWTVQQVTKLLQEGAD